jgi:hypothetical protein
VACASTPEAAERPGTAAERFTSREAVLLDFELDGHLIGAANISDPRPLIQAQLMYAVGQLNGDRSVGRYERLELSNIVIHATAQDRSDVTYHARLPVAWGGSSIPTTYVVTVPARVAVADQIRFASQYGTSCVDPSSGFVDGGSMFLFYRPQRMGCVLDPNDVVTSTATVKESAGNTTGKYPEYDRIWEDGALKVVATFSRYGADPNVADDGSRAYDSFVGTAGEYLRSLQPNDAQRATTVGATGTLPQAKLGATLPDGRAVTIDVMLVGHRLSADEASFDPWYNALTPAADLILYSGHAGLGDNVRALMMKGVFRSRQYAIWGVNGCDTLAYVDRSLAARRAVLNPDDPLGTKYMDTVSNVMAGYFDTTPATAMTFIQAIVAAGAPEPNAAKTYQAIFASIDPEQVVVVTGEEDNEFKPRTAQPAPAARAPASASPPPPGTAYGPMPSHISVVAPYLGGGRCDAGGRGGHGDSTWGVFALLGLGAIAARRRLRTAVIRAARSTSRRPTTAARRRGGAGREIACGVGLLVDPDERLRVDALQQRGKPTCAAWHCRVTVPC